MKTTDKTRGNYLLDCVFSQSAAAPSLLQPNSYNILSNLLHIVAFPKNSTIKKVSPGCQELENCSRGETSHYGDDATGIQLVGERYSFRVTFLNGVGFGAPLHSLGKPGYITPPLPFSGAVFASRKRGCSFCLQNSRCSSWAT